MPACTPNSRASYEAQVTTLRGSVGSPLPPTMTGRPASSGWRRSSTDARNWSRSTCRTQLDVGEAMGVRSPSTQLARQAFPGVAQRLEGVSAGIQLVLHIIHVE